MKPILLIFGLLLASSQGLANEAPAPLEASFDASAGSTVQAANSDLGFMDRYYPFSLPSKLHPKVEEIKTITWVTTCICPFLGAIVSQSSLDSPPENQDLWMTAVFHFLISWAVSVGLSWTGVGSLFWLVDSLYLAPVAILGSWHRAYGGKMTKKSSAANKPTAPPNMAMAY